MQRRISVQAAEFNVADEHAHLKQAGLEVGAVATFVGSVRDINEDDRVSVLHLEHYPGMTEKELGRILDEAAERWQPLGATVTDLTGRSPAPTGGSATRGRVSTSSTVTAGIGPPGGLK